MLWRGYSSVTFTGASTTRKTAVTGYKSLLNWRRAGCHVLSSSVGGTIVVHWSTIATSSRADPGQLDVDPPRSACLNGCLELRVPYSTGGSINYAPGKNNFKKKKLKTPALRIASWNIRMMRTGLSDDLQEIDDAHKTAVIDHELHRLAIDIAALHETWLPDSGSMREKHYTFWQGKGVEENREHGVDLVEHSAAGTKRILTLCLFTSTQNLVRLQN